MGGVAPIVVIRSFPHDVAMTEFVPIEQTAIDAILNELIEQRAAIAQQLIGSRVQLIGSRVMSRENTGGGFFTELEVSMSTHRLTHALEPIGQNVHIAVSGLEYGHGMILHFKDGYANLLEGYSVGGEDTSAIDFSHVRFALIDRPGPMPTNGS